MSEHMCLGHARVLLIYVLHRLMPLHVVMRVITQARQTRALLIFNEAQRVEVLADQKLILSGKEAYSQMGYTLQAWSEVQNRSLIMAC